MVMGSGSRLDLVLELGIRGIALMAPMALVTLVFRDAFKAKVVYGLRRP